MNLADYGTAVIRTAAPAAVGAVVAWGTAHGVHLPAGSEPTLEAVVGFAAATGYYALVHALEAKYPKLGALLGVPKRPIYTGAAPSLTHRAAAGPGRHAVGAVADDVPTPEEVTGADYEPDPSLRQ